MVGRAGIPRETSNSKSKDSKDEMRGSFAALRMTTLSWLLLRMTACSWLLRLLRSRRSRSRGAIGGGSGRGLVGRQASADYHGFNRSSTWLFIATIQRLRHRPLPGLASISFVGGTPVSEWKSERSISGRSRPSLCLLTLLFGGFTIFSRLESPSGQTQGGMSALHFS